MDEAGSAYTSKDMFAGSKAEVDFVQVGIENILRNCLIICPLPSPKIPTIQVLVAIDARPNIKIKAISHKQFVEFVGTHDVPGKPNIEQVRINSKEHGS